MAALAAGDMRGLAELVRRHQGRALALAYRILADWGLAEDAAQEAFVRVCRSAGSYRPEAKLTTWLYRIVTNLCLDGARRARHAPRLMADPPPVTSGDDPAEPIEKDEQSRLVRRAIGELPERQRVVIVLHRYHDLSHREVAEATGWTTSAVESLLVRAYANLRDALRPYVEE